MTKTHDLTTGSLAGHFRRLAVPAAIGMVFSTLYNVVDVFFAGLISTDAQAGLAISFQAFFIFVTIGFGLGSAMPLAQKTPPKPVRLRCRASALQLWRRLY